MPSSVWGSAVRSLLKSPSSVTKLSVFLNFLLDRFFVEFSGCSFVLPYDLFKARLLAEFSGGFPIVCDRSFTVELGDGLRGKLFFDNFKKYLEVP